MIGLILVVYFKNIIGLPDWPVPRKTWHESNVENRCLFCLLGILCLRSTNIHKKCRILLFERVVSRDFKFYYFSLVNFIKNGE